MTRPIRYAELTDADRNEMTSRLQTLRKYRKADLRQMVLQKHRIFDASELCKDQLVTHMMISEFGNNKCATFFKW